MPDPSATVGVFPVPAAPHPHTGEHFVATVKWEAIPISPPFGTPVVQCLAILQTRDTPTSPWVDRQTFRSFDTLPPFIKASGDWTTENFTAPDIGVNDTNSIEARMYGAVLYKDLDGSGAPPIEVYQYFPIFAF